MNKNKNGVLLLTPFFSPNIGGVETHLDDLVAALAEKEYQVFVQTYSPITTKNTFWKSHESNESFVHISRYKWFGGNIFNKLENYPILDFLYLTPYLFIRSLFFMIINSRSINTIHAQGLNAGIIGIALKLVFRKRLLISLHSVYSNVDKNKLSSRMTRFILNGADIVLGMSKAVNNQFIHLGIKENQIKEYRYWVNIDRFKPMNLKEARRQIGIDDCFTVIFVGRLIPIKGVKLLVDIARDLKQIQFLFIGTGPLGSFLKNVSLENSNILFRGQIQNHELPVYYNSADVFCIPSQYKEGLGRVVMESVSCGVPVVGSSLGGISEAVNNTVSVLMEPTYDNLKRSILMLYKDNDHLQSLKSNCREYAVMNYSKKSLDLITKHYA
jgi:glycosyltransferase involved in cell wall biosynthesis